MEIFGESYYSLVGTARGLAKFDAQTTHREAYTPKTIQRLRLTSSSTNAQSTKRTRQAFPIENLTTNQVYQLKLPYYINLNLA